MILNAEMCCRSSSIPTTADERKQLFSFALTKARVKLARPTTASNSRRSHIDAPFDQNYRYIRFSFYNETVSDILKALREFLFHFLKYVFTSSARLNLSFSLFHSLNVFQNCFWRFFIYFYCMYICAFMYQKSFSVHAPVCPAKLKSWKCAMCFLHKSFQVTFEIKQLINL